MTKKQKLELTWVGKENRPRLEPRILIEDPAKSYHAAARVTDADIFDNVLIHGDNLLALKALEADHAGQVKCVFIDPPYNTGSAFTHYDDGLEHSIWLGLMRDRLEIIRRLLAEDGSLWITIDDNEAHYLKVMCDEVFGRANFVSNVVWQKKYSKQNDAKWLSTSHDHILLYAKNKETWRPNAVERNADQLKGYSNIDNDPRGLWQSVVYTCAKTRAERPNLYYGIEHPRTGELIYPSETRVWGYDPNRHAQHVRDGLIWWGKNQEKDKPRLKSFLQKVGTGLVPDTLWFRDEAGDNQDAKREALAFNSADVFPTPKPEKLLSKILQIATNAGDLVIDSFAGSGTTGAVAHKMGRRWIMVELGDHCTTHIVPRLAKVIDGSDQGGISKAVDWKGGGGFRFYELAPSLLETDKWGREVISSKYDAAMLAQALCKLEGFTYAPSDSVYWQQGHSSESDFLYVTTQTLEPEELAALSEEVGEGRSLLILCAAFRGNADFWPNLTLRKIPNHIRSKCEWGHDDYSLNVANLPMAEREPAPPPPAQSSLFDGEDAA
ncbi:site-specific DNA-methyltransferase [Sphingopyxis bauzanensis]|uniref:site-specific DNA-methyltransferase (adenine-specific) n=1 Tax=Sphingopyxis bauzanensis TaxID=651663 RepID=A0A246JSR4_9SPHN|nr:site-specific DNA-methyltransferase [Sphingopyxis bauzanensis]OWQ96055.1 site-specific DNA-methyltransferase [Sphingopyxis bauzanensis]GGJ52665.1 site-specific DNA-methyltransferase [Sphingopyxis bauzanensis]